MSKKAVSINEQQADLFGNDPYITGLHSIKSALKPRDGENYVEFSIKGITNVRDTAMLKTGLWAVAVAEWLVRVCDDDYAKARSVIMSQHDAIAAQYEDGTDAADKGLESTGTTSEKIKGNEVEAVFVCQTVMQDLMRLSTERIAGMFARWLLALCNADLYDAMGYLNDGYQRIYSQDAPLSQVGVLEVAENQAA